MKRRTFKNIIAQHAVIGIGICMILIAFFGNCIQGERDRCFRELDKTVVREFGCDAFVGAAWTLENKQKKNLPTDEMSQIRDYMLYRCLIELQEAERCKKKPNTPTLNIDAWFLRRANERQC